MRPLRFLWSLRHLYFLRWLPSALLRQRRWYRRAFIIPRLQDPNIRTLIILLWEFFSSTLLLPCGIPSYCATLSITPRPFRSIRARKVIQDAWRVTVIRGRPVHLQDAMRAVQMPRQLIPYCPRSVHHKPPVIIFPAFRFPPCRLARDVPSRRELSIHRPASSRPGFLAYVIPCPVQPDTVPGRETTMGDVPVFTLRNVADVEL